MNCRKAELSSVAAWGRPISSKASNVGIQRFVNTTEVSQETVVDAVYDKICRDTRHKRITQIIREPILERDFTGWTMGYSTVAPMEAGKLLGENDFFNKASCVNRLDSGRAKTLLIALGKRRWQLERSGMFRALGRHA